MGETKRLKFKLIGLGSFILAALFLVFYPKTASADQDVTPPVIEKLEWILPEKEILDVGDSITLHIEYTDDNSGLGYVSTWLNGPYNKSIYNSGWSSSETVKDGKVYGWYDVQFTLNSSSPRGKWSLGYLALTDETNNSTSVNISELITKYGFTKDSFDFGFKGIDYNKSYNNDVVPTFNGSATLNGIKFLSGQSVSNDGTYSLYITEPNGEHTTIQFTIDKTAPIIGGVTNNGIYNNDVSLSFNEGIGMLSIGNRYSSITEKQLNLALEGKYYFYVVDEAGNETNKISFLIDKTAPTIISSLSNSNPTNKDFYISITGKDTKEGYLVNSETSGIAKIELPDGKIINNSSAKFNVSNNGTYVFKMYDLAGNLSTKQVKISNFDRTPPEVVISLTNSKPTNKEINIKIESKDSSGHGNITLPNGHTAKNTSMQLYKVTKNGSYKFIVADKAGNTISKTVKVANIDKTAPKVESSLSTTKATNKDVEIRITGSDSSKIENITLPNKKTVKSSSTKYKVSKNGSYTFKVKDKAGNTTSKTVKVSNIDKSAPGKPSVNKVTSKSKTVTGKAEKNATAYVYKGSKQLGKATVNSKGAYTVKIAAQKKNTKLSVYVQDNAGNKGKTVSVTVK